MHVGQFYDHRWQRETFVNVGRFAESVRLVPPSTGQPRRVLDLGCGVGHFSQFLLDAGVVSAEELNGSDVSEWAVQQACERGFRAFAWDIESRPTKTPWDLIFFLECLEHVFKPSTVLRNIRDSLSPHGFLILSTPNFCHLQWRLRLLIGRGHEPPENGHIALFDPGQIRPFFKKARLEIDEARCITRLESFYFPGRIVARLKGWISPATYHENRYNYVRTRLWSHLFGEIMLFRLRRDDAPAASVA